MKINDEYLHHPGFCLGGLEKYGDLWAEIFVDAGHLGY